MKTRTLGMIALAGAALTTPALAVGCNQPKPRCVSEHAASSGYILTYKLTSGDAKACTKTGEIVGIEDYHPVTAPNTRDLSVTSVAFQTSNMELTKQASECFSMPDAMDGYTPAGNYADAKDNVYALGTFDSEYPDSDDFCTISTFSPAEQNIPAIPQETGGNSSPNCTATDNTPLSYEAAIAAGAAMPMLCDPDPTKPPPASGDCCVCQTEKDAKGNTVCATDNMGNPVLAACLDPDQPAQDTKYEWSNLKMYVTAAAQGTQLTVHLKDTENGNVCEYDAIGMWPAVACGSDPKNPDLECSTEPNIDAGLPTGSGISPDFPTKCTAIDDGVNQGMYCALVGTPPSLVSGQ